MWFTRKFTSNQIKTKGLGICQGFRIDKGEWVLYSKQNYERMSKKEQERRKTKLDKKKAKIDKMLNKDWELERVVKEDIENQLENEKHDDEY